MSLDGLSGAELASDKATAQKRIWAFLKLCAKFIPCEHEAYDLAVASLDAEVDDDVSEACKIHQTVSEQCFAVILRAQREAVSVLIQVLYSLHQGHVLFLSRLASETSEQVSTKQLPAGQTMLRTPGQGTLRAGLS